MRLWIGTAVIIGLAIYCYLPFSNEIQFAGPEIETLLDHGHHVGINAYDECATSPLPNHPNIADSSGALGCKHIGAFPTGVNATWRIFKQPSPPYLTLKFLDYGQASGVVYVYDLTLRYMYEMPPAPPFDPIYCFGPNFTVVYVPPRYASEPFAAPESLTEPAPPSYPPEWPSFNMSYQYVVNPLDSLSMRGTLGEDPIIVPPQWQAIRNCTGHLGVYFEPTRLGAFGCVGFAQKANYTWSFNTGGPDVALLDKKTWARPNDYYQITTYASTWPDPDKVVAWDVETVKGGQVFVEFIALKNSTTGGFKATFLASVASP